MGDLHGPSEVSIPTPTRGGRAAVMLLLPSALAVTAGLIAIRLHFEPPTVPKYTLSGSSAERSLGPLDAFEMRIEPDATVTGAIGARAFLVRGTECRPWDAPISVGLDGTVRISGTVDKLFAGVPLGTWEVSVAVGRPEVLPTAPADILRSNESDPRPSAWRLVREPIRLDAP